MFGETPAIGAPVSGETPAIGAPMFGETLAIGAPVLGETPAIGAPVFGETSDYRSNRGPRGVLAYPTCRPSVARPWRSPLHPFG